MLYDNEAGCNVPVHKQPTQNCSNSLTSMEVILENFTKELDHLEYLVSSIDYKIDSLEYLKNPEKTGEDKQINPNSIVSTLKYKLDNLHKLNDRLQETYNRLNQIIP